MGIILISFILSACHKDFQTIENPKPSEFGPVSEEFTWNTTHQILCKVGLLDASLGDVKCRVNVYRPDPFGGAVVVYSGSVENEKAVNASITLPTATRQIRLEVIKPDGSLYSKEMEVTNPVEYTFTGSGGKSGLSIDDTDNDGVADILDDFPTNPDYAYSYSFPQPMVFSDAPITVTSWSTYCFEDLWPSKGDFDMNDLVINYNYEIITDANHFVKRINGHFKVKASGACSQWKHGFGISLSGLPSGEVQSVSGFDISGNYIDLSGNGLEKDKFGNLLDPAVIIPFDNFDNVIQNPAPNFFNTLPGLPCGTSDQIDIVITLKEPTTIIDADIDIGNFNAFLIRNRDRTYEIHKVDFAPTSYANLSIFGLSDDASKPNENTWYRTKDNLPWALDLPIDFNYPSEYVNILDAYPQFQGWAQSSGTANQSWYLYPSPVPGKIFSCDGSQPPSLQTGLVAYYPFNGNANDESGNGNNGIVNGAVLALNRFGDANKSYSFNGVNNDIEIADKPNLHSLNQITLSVWFQTSDSSSFWTKLVGKHYDASIGSFYIVWEHKYVRFSAITGYQFGGITSGNLTLGNWHHACGVYNGEKMSLFVDGLLVNTALNSGSINETNYPVTIGLSERWNEYFHGFIDDIRIYNRALSDFEVLQLYHENGWVGSNLPPVAASVQQTGTAQVGQTLTGNYEYSDPENDLQGTSTYKWYRADDAIGTNEAQISGATSYTYTLQTTDMNKYVRFAVIPVALTGSLQGTETKSTAFTFIPQLNNFTDEFYSLNDNLVPQGWTFEIFRQPVEFSNGKITAKTIDGWGGIGRPGIIPQGTTSMKFEWDGALQITFWGMFTELFVYYGTNEYLEIYSQLATVNNSVSNRIFVNHYQWGVRTNIFEKVITPAYDDYHFSVILFPNTMNLPPSLGQKS